jgi:hypothetical protein
VQKNKEHIFTNVCSNVQCHKPATHFTQLKRNELRRACILHVASILDLYQGVEVSKIKFNNLLGIDNNLLDIILSVRFWLRQLWKKLKERLLK